MNGGGFASVCLLWYTLAFFILFHSRGKKVTEVLNINIKIVCINNACTVHSTYTKHCLL